MTDVYQRLAKKLDELPNGYPETESGVELRILRKVFTPEEAENTLKLRPVAETVEEIANRIGEPVDEMQAILDDLVLKGQIGTFKQDAKQMYKMVPFAVGFYEEQFLRKDKDEKWLKEFCNLFEEYLPAIGECMVGFEPAYFRVVPVSTEIEKDLHVHRYDDIRGMVEEAKSFLVHDCMCRREQGLRGNPCRYPLDVCLNFSNEENAYERYPERGKIISKEEAFRIVDRAEKEGLVHLSYNVREGQDFICACCTCCCGVLRIVKEFGVPTVLAKSDYVAAIDQEACTACGICKDERCPMDAIAEEDEEYRVLHDRCIGCGACAPTCPTEAITLVHKPEAERSVPPANVMDWEKMRAAARGVQIKLD